MKPDYYRDVVFLDNGMYASEGFTSGLLIVIRSILKMFKEQGLSVGVFSCVDAKAAKFWDDKERGLQHRVESDIDVFENLLGEEKAGSVATHQEMLNNFFNDHPPKFIVMNTPAVFLSELDVLYRKAANQCNGKVIHVLCDYLFPTIENHPKHLVDALYTEIDKGEVIAISEKVKAAFESGTGVDATLYTNPICLKEVDCAGMDREEKYIGLVNVHPVKGIELFDKLAGMMPEHEFMVVETWPDVPEYSPGSANISVKKFCKDPREFYKNLKMLLVPSLYSEGTAMVTVEALYNGIPVIANRIGSLPEVGDHMIRFIEPPTILEHRMVGSIMYPVCEPKSMRETCEEYCTVINEILSSIDDNERQRLRADAKAYGESANQGMVDMIKTWIAQRG